MIEHASSTSTHTDSSAKMYCAPHTVPDSIAMGVCFLRISTALKGVQSVSGHNYTEVTCKCDGALQGKGMWSKGVLFSSKRGFDLVGEGQGFLEEEHHELKSER